MDGMIGLFSGIVSFAASILGAVCGIGGGVIMKPVFDALGILDVVTVSFLSGCTVLCMSAVSVGQSLREERILDLKIMTPMAVGAVLGGLAGKRAFQAVEEVAGNQSLVGFVQALAILAVTLLTLAYTLWQRKARGFRMRRSVGCAAVGIVLGIMSSFLGIGGGPVNLMALGFLFGMQVKEAAISSIYVILFSQASSLIQTVAAGTVPDVNIGYLAIMAAGGIAGGIAGGRLHRRLGNRQVDRLFVGAMLLIIIINIYNAFAFGSHI